MVIQKFHINEDGNPGLCKAKPGNCPFGNELSHYSTAIEARSAFEKFMKDKVFVDLTDFRFKDEKWENIPWIYRKKIIVSFAREVLKKRT